MCFSLFWQHSQSIFFVSISLLRSIFLSLAPVLIASCLPVIVFSPARRLYFCETHPLRADSSIAPSGALEKIHSDFFLYCHNHFTNVASSGGKANDRGDGHILFQSINRRVHIHMRFECALCWLECLFKKRTLMPVKYVAKWVVGLIGRTNTGLPLFLLKHVKLKQWREATALTAF